MSGWENTHSPEHLLPPHKEKSDPQRPKWAWSFTFVNPGDMSGSTSQGRPFSRSSPLFCVHPHVVLCRPAPPIRSGWGPLSSGGGSAGYLPLSATSFLSSSFWFHLGQFSVYSRQSTHFLRGWGDVYPPLPFLIKQRPIIVLNIISSPVPLLISFCTFLWMVKCLSYSIETLYSRTFPKVTMLGYFLP